METKTLSIPKCPQCGKPHHLPLVFIKVNDTLWEAQCIWNLGKVYAIVDKNQSMRVIQKSEYEGDINA